jgi:hypothetical protein
MKKPFNCCVTLSFSADNLMLMGDVNYKTFAENELEAIEIAEAAVEYMPSKFAEIVTSNAYKLNEVKPTIADVKAVSDVGYSPDFDMTDRSLRVSNE